MSATMVAVIPLALLGVVALLGFVGCFLDASGFPETSPYDKLVKGESSLIAFWTLTEPEGTLAIDEQGGFNGTYSGTVTLNQPGLIPGDVEGGQQDPSALFNGGVVSVGFKQAVNVGAPFTVEAWVKPAWDKADTALRGVVVSNNKASAAGFGLFASTDNTWLFSLGMTPAAGPGTSIEVKPPAETIIDFSGDPIHVVVTMSAAGVCTIFANTVPIATMDTSTMGTYTPLTDGTTPLFIGAGAPDQGASPPMFPFNGNIQCVALYSTDLPQTAIMQHFTIGKAPA